jgi:protein kinase A
MAAATSALNAILPPILKSNHTHDNSSQQSHSSGFNTPWRASTGEFQRLSVPDIHKSTSGSQNHFRPEDFTVGKTLGTGTFARVSLAKIAKPKDEKERDQVFALKVLRKTEGGRIHP